MVGFSRLKRHEKLSRETKSAENLQVVKFFTNFAKNSKE